VAGVAITFWEQMAAEVILIVGDDGFNTLYAKSISLTQSRFLWLVASPLGQQSDRCFAELRTSLEGQTSAQASEANILLLITFTDILASLIGELLTTRILNLAWSTDISNSTGQEFQK
jgi:hypothetical protein